MIQVNLVVQLMGYMSFDVSLRFIPFDTVSRAGIISVSSQRHDGS
jgi:hypothetical protein